MKRDKELKDQLMKDYMMGIIAQNREPSLEELTVMYDLFRDKNEIPATNEKAQTSSTKKNSMGPTSVFKQAAGPVSPKFASVVHKRKMSNEVSQILQASKAPEAAVKRINISGNSPVAANLRSPVKRHSSLLNLPSLLTQMQPEPVLGAANKATLQA